MLVLTRKLGESIVIAGNIEVQVVEVEGSRVRLGITAPREVRIRRSELAAQPPDAAPERKPERETVPA